MKVETVYSFDGEDAHAITEAMRPWMRVFGDVGPEHPGYGLCWVASVPYRRFTYDELAVLALAMASVAEGLRSRGEEQYAARVDDALYRFPLAVIAGADQTLDTLNALKEADL